jgi:hypothetical protein
MPLTRHKSGITILTEDVANSWFGGLFGTAEGSVLDPSDPLVSGHVHDGLREDGHAQKVNLSAHVTGQLDGADIQDASITADKISFMLAGSVFDTTGNITSNSPGTLATDDFVFGSDSLDDDTDANHDSRMLFDKSTAAFRTGTVTGTAWDAASRGANSFATGLDTTASGAGSVTFGDSNINAGATSSILGGGGVGPTANDITAGAVGCVILTGLGTTIDDGLICTATGVNHTIGDGVSTDIGSSILSGSGGIIDGGSDYAVVCGGGSGTAGTGGEIRNGSNRAFIGAGGGHVIGATVSAAASAIVGGTTNDIDETTRAFIGAGLSNSILSTSTNSSVISGILGTISSSSNAFIGAGDGNTVTTTSTDSSIVGGNGNTITSALSSFIGGGDANSITSNFGTIMGGGNNVADSVYGTALGKSATTDSYGVVAQASGHITTVGDAQRMSPVWRITTTDGTANVEAFLDGSSERFLLDDDSTYAFFIRGVGRRTDADGESGHYTIEGTADRNAGVTALVGSTTVTIIDEDTAGWDVRVTANDTNDALQVDVTGIAANDISWVFIGDIVKVTG